MREQRLVFGEDAALYHRARPSYPESLVDDVLAYLGAPDPAGVRALEVGAGTGKATVAFARRGVRVHALEPDPAMAAVAERTCAGLDVEIERASFEDWSLEPEGVDVVFSGQAWHWTRPETRVERAAAALVGGGALALFWHRVGFEESDPVRAALDECYRKAAPSLYAAHGGFPGLTPPALEEAASDELASSSAFIDVAVHTHPWRATRTTDQFVELLASQSDHRMLAEPERDALFVAVGALVDGLGGTVDIPWSTLLVLGRRRGG